MNAETLTVHRNDRKRTLYVHQWATDYQVLSFASHRHARDWCDADGHAVFAQRGTPVEYVGPYKREDATHDAPAQV
jgi:hypothetical protein